MLKERYRKMMEMITPGQLIYWWLLRGAMVFALIDTAFLRGSEYSASNPPIQIVANLVGMFAFELIQLFFPQKNRLRFLSSSFQNVTALGFFLGSFGGAYLNLYYILPMYDKALHVFGTAEAVYIGYEYLCATQLKLRKTAPYQIVNLGALGFGFILSSAWEVFEFVYDQFFGGDAQHWNYQLALNEAGGNPEIIFQMFPMSAERLAERFPIMDTMGDIVLNFLGAFLMYIFLCIRPYRHIGEKDINRRIEEMNRAARAEQTNRPSEPAEDETVTVSK
ncbi:MAG: hypothetical protein IKN72_03950 [Clostridia bacterium]|nr:hypothetical protein [Clostridia bacterium]